MNKLVHFKVTFKLRFQNFVVEPGGFYLSHVSLKNGKDITIANSIGDAI